MIRTKTAVCVCSGGIDSTVAATIASHEDYELHLFHASYGQRAEKREKEAVEKEKPCGLTVYNRKAYIPPH